MIQDGDRVLVCISGGKDSLSLLHTLKQYQFAAKSKVTTSYSVCMCVFDSVEYMSKWLWQIAFFYSRFF